MAFTSLASIRIRCIGYWFALSLVDPGHPALVILVVVYRVSCSFSYASCTVRRHAEQLQSLLR